MKGFLEKEADGWSRQLPQCGKGRELLRGLFRAFSAGLFKFFPIERIPVITNRPQASEVIVAGFFAKKRLQKLQDSVARNFQ